MAIVVVMDIGKTNAKLSVVDGVTGELISSDSSQMQVVNADPYPHLDTRATWSWYVSRLSDLQQSHSIDTIVVTAHGATAALLGADEFGDIDLVLPVIDYEFDGVDECREEYNALRDPFEHTYSPDLPQGLNLGRQLYWQRKRFPEQFARAQFLVPYAQYWSWLLTGVPVTEVSTVGSHTDLWNPLDKCFSDFANRQGFAELFAPLKFAGDILGPVREKVRAQTGLTSSCKVLVGIHDSNASLLPWITSRAAPFTVMSTGTWVILFSLGASLKGLQAERDCTANVTVFSEPVACARFMGGREYATVAGNGVADVSLADLQTVLELRVLALPAFAETGGPYSGNKGVIRTEQSLTVAQRHALASLYCALVCDESLTLCNSAGDIIVEGAFARNDLLLRCLAVFRNEQKVYASADSTGTTMGALMLASGSDTGSATALAEDDARPPSTPDLKLAAESETELTGRLIEYREFWRGEVQRHNAG